MKFQATNKIGQRDAACEWGRPPALALSSFSRRGSALLLVVVLVLLLALMGTTFLFVMRAARLQASGPGSGTLMQGSWPTVSQNDLDAAIGTVKSKVVGMLTTAVRPGGYLMAANPESAYTHPATANTLYLADRFPVTEPDRTGAGANYGRIQWRFISAHPDHTGDPHRDLYLSQYRVTYPASGNWPMDANGNPYPSWAQLALSGRSRFFPAFTTEANKAQADNVAVVRPTDRILAGDADGDGIADCLLYYQNSANGYDFYTGVRVVDNNAAVNVNTAWRSLADYDFTNNPILATDSLTGYLGAFRSNIGLYEMLLGSTAESTFVAPSGDADADLFTLDRFRFGGVSLSLKDIYTGNDASATGTQVAGVEYLTVADALEHGLVRRLDKNTKPGFYTTSTRFTAFDQGTLTHDQLVSRFCLVNPNFSNTKLTANLLKTDLAYAPNTWSGASGVPNVVAQFQFYGANQSDYWYHTALSTDSKAGTSRQMFFGLNNNPNYPNSLALNNIVKTIRPHLVGENGVTVSAPFVAAPAGLVTVSTTAADWDVPNDYMADYAATDTPRKAWANGASFGELWRAYYGVFKATPGDPNPVQASRYNNKGNALGEGLPAWDADRQLLLRSAIAAVNTIQARQDPTADAEVRTVAIGGTNIRIFGAKRQPFITEVMSETGRKDPAVAYDAVANPIEVKWVAIELHNPYSTPIDLAREQLFFVSGGVTWTLGANLSAQGTIAAGGFKTIIAKRTPWVNTGSPVDGLTAVTNPANDTILNNFPLAAAAGTSVRLVAWDGKTAATANGYDMIPQDEVDLSSLPFEAGVPQRFRYVRPTQTASGSRFNCVYNAIPVLADFGVIKDTAATPPVAWSGTLDGTLNAENPAGVAPKDGLIIQVGNYSTYKPASVTNSAFPFKGFARDGDLLSVAYIGNYAYVNAATPYTCSVGRDAYYAEDGNAADDAYEAVGRFAPLSALSFGTDMGATYDWAARLFDFVTAVQHPGSEYSPDSPPELIPAVAGKKPLDYTGRSIQGKLNINTASWQALAALPLVPMNPQVPATNSRDGAASETVKLAKAIVNFRDGLAGLPAHGAFKSIFELNLVPEFAWRTAGLSAAADLTTFDLNIAGAVGTHGVGDLSPTDNAIGDFEQRLLGLTRISNLITTRSDSFTVYIIAQAWKTSAAPNSAGSPPPIMVGEKRTAYIMDRTGLTRDATILIDQHDLKDRP